MTKHWDCKLVFKEEEDGPNIYLLDYVYLLEQEEDKIPNNTSYSNFLIDSMALETVQNSRRSSTHLE
jgi:hypothetical protein